MEALSNGQMKTIFSYVFQPVYEDFAVLIYCCWQVNLNLCTSNANSFVFRTTQRRHAWRIDAIDTIRDSAEQNRES